MNLLKFTVISLCFLTACNPDQKLDSQMVKQNIENSKIKKISEGEILASADLKGVFITDSLQKEISEKLRNALSKDGIEAAIPICVLSNNSTKESLEKKFHATISRTSSPSKLRNPKNAPAGIQKDILDAYAYNLEKGTALFKDVQIQEKEIVFNAPIYVSEQQCLKCHGTVDKDLTKAEYQSILASYPQDKSINLKMNEFIGLWTVKFSKKEFIQEVK